MYTFPSDGYANMSINKNIDDAGYAYVYGSKSNEFIQISAVKANNISVSSVFVRKGMRTNWYYKKSDQVVYRFIPLVD